MKLPPSESSIVPFTGGVVISKVSSPPSGSYAASCPPTETPRYVVSSRFAATGALPAASALGSSAISPVRSINSAAADAMNRFMVIPPIHRYFVYKTGNYANFKWTLVYPCGMIAAVNKN